MVTTVGAQEYRVYDLETDGEYMVLAHDGTEAVRIAWAKYYPNQRGIVSHFRSSGRDITAIGGDENPESGMYVYGA